MKTASRNQSNTSCPRIFAFTVIATCIAYPLRNNLLDLHGVLLFGIPFLQALLEGAGVFVATSVATSCFTKYWSPANYFGDSTIHSFATYLVPILVFTIFGINNSRGVDPQL